MRRLISFDGLMILCLVSIVITGAFAIIHMLAEPQPSHNVEGQIVSIDFEDKVQMKSSNSEQHNRTIKLQLKSSSGPINLVFEKLSAHQFLTFQKHWLVGYCVHIDYDLPNTIDSYLKSCPDK